MRLLVRLPAVYSKPPCAGLIGISLACIGAKMGLDATFPDSHISLYHVLYFEGLPILPYHRHWYMSG